jgi:hypothetical protein
VMRLIHMSQHEQEQFKELKSLMGPDGLGLLQDIEVQSFKLPTSGKKVVGDKSDLFYFVRLLPLGAGDDSWRNYTEVSFGTRRLLRILVSMLSDKSTVMLLEQPEDGIHPGLLHKLMPLLKAYSDQCQFIVASHSPAIFNRLSPNEIRLVELSNGLTKLRALTPEEVAGAEQFISQDGPLSDFIEVMQGD